METVYKFMIKTRSGQALEHHLPTLSTHRSHHLLSQRTPIANARYQREASINVTIAPPLPLPAAINCTIDCDSYTQRLRRWKKETRTKKLQAVYDENIRIFLSLSKQRSVYHFQQRKAEGRRPLPTRLLPLSERDPAMGNSRAV